MFVVSVLQAASSLAPSDKYHKNPQGGHRHATQTTSSDSGGGGETNNRSDSTSANNNCQFSHNGLTPPSELQEYPRHQGDEVDHHHRDETHHQLINHHNNPSQYQFYPTSLGSSASSSQQQQHPQHQYPLVLQAHPPHQPPYLVYKSNYSSSGSGGSVGNGSHIIIDGNTGNGGGVEGSHSKYYYYNGHYYPIEELEGDEDPDQIFTITATPTTLSSSGRASKEVIMGRVGEESYPPGSPASVGGGGSGLFKSKSGSIPMSSSPHTRGFRDTFISSMSPPVHAHSAESSPLHRSASATTANKDHDRFISSANNISASGNKQEGNKKWTFGGLFRRNKKQPGGAPSATNNNNSIVETGAASSATPYTNSNGNSPAKLNNNYGSGLVSPRPLTISPAPSSSVGVSVDPYGCGGVGTGQSENNNRQSCSSTPKFVNAESQTRAKGKLSESDISTCDSDFELTHHHEIPPEPAPQESKGYKQNFLVRRLSRRREKAAAKKKAAAEQAQASTSASNLHNNNSSTNGFVSSQHGYLEVPQMKKRVGSSPDSLHTASEPWPSWETTKKPQTQLQAVQQQQHRLQNYSSNGSLSLSQEGSNNNNSNQLSNGSKSSRAAVKEAVKARAIARRESFLHDSSSSDDDTEERSRSSLQGSFSSLNSRNRRQRAFNMQQAQFQQQRHLFPVTTTGGGMSCASPSSPMPVPLDYRNSMSPNMNRRLMMMGGGAPGSPKWEARVIYQQENITENNQPVVFRLPRKERNHSGAGAAPTTIMQTNPTSCHNPSQMSQNNGDQSFIMATEMISEDQHVVTAGLKVPFLGVQTPPQQQQHNIHQDQQCFRNGQLMYPDDPVQYANVPNGMRGGRSGTPYTFNATNANSGGPGAIHHASPTPPPPPPPRRDFTRGNVTTNNPNFYRPVSCSYLDAYASQLHQMNEQQQMMRQHSPMLFNGNYIYPNHHQNNQQYYQYQGHEIRNGSTGSRGATPVHNVDGSGVRASPRQLTTTGNHPTNGQQQQQLDVDKLRHPPLIRSPSEPPAIRIEQARGANSPVKRLVSSPMPNGGVLENGDSRKSSPSKSMITSKLGFPVRRLQEAGKLTGPQSPVHLRASEFWRKKESEVTGLSPVGNNQKKYLSRIRSADSSPLPVPKMRKSPGIVAASNESISSLSSFSENAASPGPPKNSSSPINPSKQQQQAGGTKITPLRAISKTPNPQQLTYGNNSKDKENNNSTQTTQQSAVERLKVRIPSAPDGIKISNPHTHPGSSSLEHNNNSKTVESNNNPIRALIELNNGKTPGKNLEDALNELEDMYKSLRLSDEDLLDRAERRDLPTPHQELRDAPLIPIPQGYRFEHLGSIESLGTGSGSSGTNCTNQSGEIVRVRAPPMRRSSRPDTVSDDMANRRLAFPDGKPLDPRVVVAKTGSYLARSPAFSPCTSPCPPDSSSSSYPLTFLSQDDPDLTLDDVTFRNYKRANSIRIIEPQPPFGIPLGPITAAPATDYLHSKPTESYRPIFGNLKTPDVVNDDIAFRNLRKDLGQESSLATKDWTPRLFSPNRESSFNYPQVKDSKKLRAIRSLSANITHMIPANSGGTGGARESPNSSYQQYNRDIGKWSSYSDLHRRASAGSPARASTYLQPSWVEQIEKVQTSTETLTDHRNSSSRLSTAILDPPEHWERKFPKKTVELTPPIYDPEKPRRPWTDIILESFEKEKQLEMEKMAAEAEAAAAAANNKTGAKSELLEQPREDEEVDGDDDVFIDGLEEASKSEAVALAQKGQHQHHNPTNGNNSKNNESGSSFQESNPSDPHLPRPLPLLPGQKTRRGSWVEENYTRSHSSSTFHASPSKQSSSTADMNASGEEFSRDKRRKSWSDLPKDIDSFSGGAIILSGSSCSASPTRKLFNPLPPPKKIRQINLEAFNNNSSSVGNQGDGGVKRESSSTNGAPLDEGNSPLTSSSPDKVKPSPGRIRGEDELNELMDQLLKDADTCGESTPTVEGEVGHGAKKPTESSISTSSPLSPSSTPAAADKDKSISTTVNTHGKEMKMDGITSSSEQSCKQDLSCTIVGIIPKHQSPPEQQPANVDDGNNLGNEQPTFPLQHTISSSLKSSSSSSPPSSSQLEIDSGGGSDSKKLFKTDNNGKRNVDSGSAPVSKEINNAIKREASSGTASLPETLLEEGNNKRKEASSIEDLIESINETLPELEASCGGIGIQQPGHDTDGKPNGSSSANGSPASSIPSPSPGSPTPVLMSVSVKKESTPLATPAFPVPAKRHHLPGKQAEESLYENLPARVATGNDTKIPQSPSSSSPPFTGKRRASRSESESGAGGDNLVHSTEKIPPLTSCRRGSSVHDNNNDGDDRNEEEGQHSSSHQPSSLSSNDSEVSASGRREQEDGATTNIIRDNTDQVDKQTCSSSSLPFDNKPASMSSSTFDAFSDKSDSSSNLGANSRDKSTREPLLRKKSEGTYSQLSTERDDCNKTAICSQKRESHPVNLSLQESHNSEDTQKEIPVRETYITSSSTSTSSSSSSTEDTKRKQTEMQPVAPPVSSTFTGTTAGAKKSASMLTSAETSASEASTGMNFLRNNFPFFRNSTSRSRSQSVVSDVSRSSETGDSKKEKDKSYRRKSHLNRAFTDEAVPDNNYVFDLTPKSSKPTSQEASSLDNSAVEDGRAKPAVKLHPAIPSVLTSNTPGSPRLKSISRNNSQKHVESTPSPAPAANPTVGKVQAGEQARKSSPVVKKDSFSDAEGVCFIKKMLQKESDRDRAAAAAAKQNSLGTPSGNNSSIGYNLKKSPSAGNQSYWSKFSNSQSAFLRKLFDKPKIAESPVNSKTQSRVGDTNGQPEDEVGEKGDMEAESTEPVMGFSVAQKASFFMKLEHEQRFSKWRKNSVDLGATPLPADLESNQSVGNSLSNKSREFRPRSRYLTQPVTPTEVKEIAPLVNMNPENQTKLLEFGSQPRIWGNSFSSMGNRFADASEKGSNENPSKIPKSSYKDCDDTHKFEPIVAAGSFRERVNKFDEIVTRKIEPIQCSVAPTPTVKSYSLTRNSHITNIHTDNLGGFPMYHSASAIINSTPAKSAGGKPTANFYKNLATAYSSSSSSFSEAMSKNETTKFLPVPVANAKKDAALLEGNKRRGSASDLELSGGNANVSPVLLRSEKVRSLFVSRSGYHCDTDNLSEDGEVSSGGQEVAEIICRSYENSPVFRKKNWRSQKQVHSNFTKEIWRRCGNYENWNQRSYTNPPQQPPQHRHPVPQTFTATTNVIEVTTAAPPTLPPVAPSPPATSNLLQILTVLSSSNDELSETKPKSKKQRQGSKQVSGSESIPPVHPGHHSNCSAPLEPRINTASSKPANNGQLINPVPVGSEIFVSVPHPEDEAFQSFFCSVKSYSKVTHSHYPGMVATSCTNANGQVQPVYANGVTDGGASSSTNGINIPSTSNETLDITSVRRESDLLVMKKNIPPAKRKSSGKYKNPLRALAARMDFRQQGYTQTHTNTVQSSSDVDVTT